MGIYVVFYQLQRYTTPIRNANFKRKFHVTEIKFIAIRYCAKKMQTEKYHN